jgi:hypothetical protein
MRRCSKHEEDFVGTSGDVPRNEADFAGTWGDDPRQQVHHLHSFIIGILIELKHKIVHMETQCAQIRDLFEQQIVNMETQCAQLRDFTSPHQDTHTQIRHTKTHPS